MSYRDALHVDELRPFKNIVVVGPQRSGTRITAKILTHELDGYFFDERRYRPANWRKFVKCTEQRLRFANKIFQAPGLTHRVKDMDELGCAVVMMRRPMADIMASWDRIGWAQDEDELAKFKATAVEGSSAAVKYAFWDRVKPSLQNAFEIFYDDLSDHPMFVPKPRRRNWEYWRTEPR